MSILKGIPFLRQELTKIFMKRAADRSGIMKIPFKNKNLQLDIEDRVQKYIRDAEKQGVDLDMVSNADLKYTINLNENPNPLSRAISADRSEGRAITEKLLGKRGEVVDMAGKKLDTSQGIMGGKSVKELMDSGQVSKGARGMKKSKKVQDREMFQGANKRLKTEAQLKAEMEASNKEAVERLRNKRQLDEDEIAELDEDIGGLEYTNDFDGTVGSANKLRKERADYIRDMELEYKKGNLDPKPGEANRERFLQKKFDEMESSGDNRLMTRDEVEELSSFGLQKDMDKSVKNFKEKDFKQKKTLKDFDPEDRDPNATGGRIGLKDGEGVITVDDKIDEMISFYKDYLNQGGKMNFKTFSNKYIPENFADGGRIGYNNAGLVSEQDGPSLLDMINIQASGTKSGKQQIEGAPKGITSDKETIDAILTMDIPLTEKINLIGNLQYGKDRNRIKYKDNEIFLQDPKSYRDRNIGLDYNRGGEGFSGSATVGDRGPEFFLKYKKSFADGGVAGLLGERPGYRSAGFISGRTKSSKPKSSTSKGPAGGASAGGNYGGNVNPNQTYAGRTLSQRPSNYGGTGPSTSGGGGKPPGTNTGDGTTTTAPPNFRKLIKQRQILNFLKNQGNLSLDAESEPTGLDKLMEKGSEYFDKDGVKFNKDFNFLDNQLKLKGKVDYENIIKGNPKGTLGLEYITDTDKRFGISLDEYGNKKFEFKMPTNYFLNKSKSKPRTNFDNRFAPDISKFNFEDMTGIKSTVPANRQMAKVYNTQDIEKLLGIKDQKTAEKFVEDPYTSSPKFITREKRTEPRTQVEAMDLFRENLIREETKYPGKTFDQQRSGALEYGIRPTDRNLVPSDFLDKPGEAATQTPFSNIAAEIEEKYPMADGGPARQNFKMGKRAFLKAMLGTGAGIAGLKSGLFATGGKKATKKAITETVKSAGSGTPPPYFFRLVEKIKFMGDDTLATTDKAIAKKYKDYTMEEDFAGNIEIIKKGDDVAEDVYISYKVDDVPLRGKKGSKRIEEYEEYTARPDAEGKMKDIEQGVPDEVIDEAGDTTAMTLKRASGGIARMLGE